MWLKLESKEDHSVNFIRDYKNGKLECRYVRRDTEHVSAYISSQSGCSMLCKMCHLTAQGELTDDAADHASIIDQFLTVLNHYAECIPSQGAAKRININLMARGEPLDNACIYAEPSFLCLRLYALAEMYNLQVRINLSTIMPRSLYKNVENSMHDSSFMQRFNIPDLSIYYSLYSTNTEMRAKWLPNAMPLKLALQHLSHWQHSEKELNDLVIHFPYIEGVNDSVEDTRSIVAILNQFDLKPRFNIVRFNSPNSNYKESDESIVKRNFEMLCRAYPNERNKIVDRVGFDVKASCGMFI